MDLNGRVVGINESIISPGGAGGFVGIGFAISADTAARVVPQLVANKRVIRGWLGVVIGDLNENERDFYKAPNGGALINSVNPEGPAAKSGLQQDDVVIQAGNSPVRRSADLQAVVSGTQPGETVRLVVLRNGQQTTIDVKVGEMPDKYAGASPPAAEGAGGGEEVAQADPLGLQVQTLQPSMPQAAGPEPEEGRDHRRGGSAGALGAVVEGGRRHHPGQPDPGGLRPGLPPGARRGQAGQGQVRDLAGNPQDPGRGHLQRG